MAITFPASPTNGQTFTSGNKTWQWDGTTWLAYGASLSPTVLKVDAANARVGVNNQSPAYALDVNGTIEATQFLQGTDYLSPYQGFRNAIINGDFRINQRSFTSNTSDSTYNFDRWAQANSGGTVTVTPQTFTVGSPVATGFESANYLRMVVASQSTSGQYAGFYQHIEDVRTFANSTVTVSFWAKAASGTPKISLENTQFFGSGGSPSSYVQTPVGAVTISTSWTRYSFTFTIPSISGKTIGTTANTSSLRLFFFVSAGSALNTTASSIGIQNNTFDIWGVQIERGSVATPFEQRPIGTELALCQRYYWRTTGDASNAYGSVAMGMFSATFLAEFMIRNPVLMRSAAHTIESSTLRTLDYQTAFAGTPVLSNGRCSSYATHVTCTVSGATQYRPCLLEHNNSVSAYFGVSAEL